MSSRSPAGRPDGGGRRLTQEVRIWDLRVYEGKRRRTYTVRWVVGGQEHQDTYASRALADGFRATLLSHVQRGSLFDTVTGLPEPILREQQRRPWFEHACRYVDMKWPAAAPKSRTSIADTLATVTPALVTADRGRPSAETIRQAMYAWACVPAARQRGPADDPAVAAAATWLERNTIAVTDFEDPARGPELTRATLDALARRLDGHPASPNTVARKRAVLYNVLGYAVELGLLAANPIDRIAWRMPKSESVVDSRVVINPRQAQALLTAVAVQPGVAPRLVTFFACMYYAALRPAEALDLRLDNLASLPDQGWGEFVLTNSSPRSGKAWTNSGRSRDRRGLKHRAATATRRVPVHPTLTAFLHAHIDTFGTAPDGRLFVGPRGGTIGDSTYTTIWHRARELALTPAEVRSPLAGRPYDLRHAAVSTWLNAGTHPPQVAEWAGHSVAVLLRVYAKCIAGQEDAARRRIEDAMNPDAEE